jgi:formate dehydrogenase subunit delta
MNNLDTINKLIKMANQIGTFFESFPDREEALDGIANHLKKFWTPAMRANLIDGIDANTASELHQIVTQAIHKHRENLLSGVANSHSSAEK